MKHWRSAVCAVCVSLLSLACAHAQTPDALKNSTQLIVVTTANWSATTGRLQLFERASPNKKWEKSGSSFEVAVGKTGLGWGAGLVPPSQMKSSPSDPVKKEGDGSAPAGLFSIGTAFGYADQEPAGWKMPYLPLTPNIVCPDDSKSKYYNQLVDQTKVTPDWNDAEQMRSTDGLYTWGLFVDHNANPATPGVGSCIFMHIWKGAGVPTVGCTAMPEDKVQSLIGSLDPARKPLLLQLPAKQYAILKKSWNLPKL